MSSGRRDCLSKPAVAGLRPSGSMIIWGLGESRAWSLNPEPPGGLDFGSSGSVLNVNTEKLGRMPTETSRPWWGLATNGRPRHWHQIVESGWLTARQFATCALKKRDLTCWWSAFAEVPVSGSSRKVRAWAESLETSQRRALASISAGLDFSFWACFYPAGECVASCNPVCAASGFREWRRKRGL